MVETKYRCVEKISVDLWDEHECLVENEHFAIEESSEWVLGDCSWLSNCRLTDEEGNWLEVSREVFDRYFTQA